MRNRRSSPRLLAAALLAAIVLCGAPASAAPVDALDLAFRLASAIRTDAKDRMMAQESVVLDYGLAGALDEARSLADSVEGWRRGVAYAELALMFARAGRSDEARDLIRKAEAVRESVTGWQNPRISAHVAAALAWLGALDESRRIAAELAASDRQYGGRSASILATAYASRGDFDRAVAALRTQDSNQEVEDALWRTQGYLAVARAKPLSKRERRKALDEARRSAEAVSGWIKAEPLAEVADEYSATGKPRKAREVLAVAEEAALAAPPSAPLAAPLLAGVARGWARAENGQKARSLLEKAESVAVSNPDIGRPAMLANVAAGYSVLGDAAEASRVLALALSYTEAMINPRPRALAAIEICRALVRFEMPLTDDARARLEDVYAGLSDPW